MGYCWNFDFFFLGLISWIEHFQECAVKTSKGSISVFVCGDQEKPALITYSDVALNCICFSFFFYIDSWFFISNLGFFFCFSSSCCWVGFFVFCCWVVYRYVLFPRSVILWGRSFFVASQLLHLPYWCPRSWGQRQESHFLCLCLLISLFSLLMFL